MKTIISLFLTICSVFAFTCSAQNVSKSDVTFSDSILKAAEQGIAEAQYRLGYCYEYGKGVEKSLTEAVKWYRKAADNGDSNAQYVLGNCYKYGKGVEQSFTEAAKWFRKAADQGFSLAQELLEDKVATKAFSTSKYTQLSYGTNDTVTTITESFRVTKKFKKGWREVTKRVVGQDTTIIKDTITIDRDRDPDSLMNSLQTFMDSLQTVSDSIKNMTDSEKYRIVDSNSPMIKVLKTDGIYRMTAYKRGENAIEKYPFDVYKVITTDSCDESNDYKTYVLQLEFFEVKSNNQLVPTFILSSSTIDVVEANEKGFTNKWVCNMSNHRTIEKGTIVMEYYKKEFEPSRNFEIFHQIFTEKKKKDNNIFSGFWKRKDANGTTYKIYGNEYRMMFHITNYYRIGGSMETFEYNKNGKVTKEGGNRCDIKWKTPNSYTLTYKQSGKTFHEDWERSDFEEFKKELFEKATFYPSLFGEIQ